MIKVLGHQSVGTDRCMSYDKNYVSSLVVWWNRDVANRLVDQLDLD